MKLDAWLSTTGTPDNEFARRIGVSRVTLFRFKTGRRVPDRSTMEKISAETRGDVAPNDFFGLGATSIAPTPEAIAS
ncbi:helix-turn-helix domain-containing protein [Tardiphaga sp. 839_C3_N1_4]|uniref:helix-turn-helix domain-containing protein n=1 Tax=Tardiphaga sp. 839_C3_N1_4 TaxID=3240761 RepID=UPI003F224065